MVIYGDNTQDVNVNLSYEKLSIDYTRKMRFFFFSFGIYKNDIIVYVPTKYAKDITIKMTTVIAKLAILKMPV